jgi:hypothetical protein
MQVSAEPRWESIGLLPHWRIFLAVFLDLWFAGAAFILWDAVKNGRDMIATAPPGCLVYFENLLSCILVK